MKIVIVDNPRPLTLEHYNDVANAPLSASLNSGYALGVARQAGWDTVHLDFTSHGGEAAEMAARIMAESGDLVLFHWVYAWGHEAVVRDTIYLLRRQSATPLGAFGLFPTLARPRLLQYARQLDFILSGEFEATLADLLHSFRATGSLSPLPGLALREQAFKARPLINDLASLPLPADVGSNCDYPSLNIAASRGCFGRCSFCFIRPYYGCSRRRVRPPASLEQELEQRLARRDIRSLYFIDPTFIGHGRTERQRVGDIGRMAQQRGLPFGFETRVDSVDAETMAALANNGASTVFLGIESGCNSVLQRIGKRIDTAQIRRSIEIVRGSGISLNLGFIMFEPDTTLAEVEENFAFLEELQLLNEHALTANLLYHNQIVLYGSAAWKRFGQEGRLLRDERLPFEARYRFRDERVGLVSAAMGRLCAAYFRELDALRAATGTGDQKDCGAADKTPHHVNADDINALLKEAFLAFCAAAGSETQQRLPAEEERYLHSLQLLLAAPPYAAAG